MRRYRVRSAGHNGRPGELDRSLGMSSINSDRLSTVKAFNWHWAAWNSMGDKGRKMQQPHTVNHPPQTLGCSAAAANMEIRRRQGASLAAATPPAAGIGAAPPTCQKRKLLPNSSQASDTSNQVHPFSEANNRKKSSSLISPSSILTFAKTTRNITPGHLVPFRHSSPIESL